jgi:hypothetical protein
LPRFDYSLSQLLVLSDDEREDEETNWESIIERGDSDVTIAVNARPVAAIVITQDCDTLRADQITLCEIRPLEKIVPSLGGTLTKQVKNLIQASKKNLKWFYLPEDGELGFNKRMAVDFQVTLTVARQDLEAVRHLRKRRLNPEADEHFRERLAEFFRRYPVDEWYPLTAAEFSEYEKDYPEAERRSYQ